MEDLIPASEVATLLNVTRATVHNLEQAGKLTVKKRLGQQAQKFFDKNEVLEFAKGYRKNGRAA